MRKRVMALTSAAWLLMTLSTTAFAADEAGGWTFMVEPYGFASTIEGDASLGRVTGADVDVDFGDILEALDLAAMVHFEAIRDDKWGVVLDYGFMDLSDKVTTARGGVLKADVHQGVLEAFLMRRFHSGPNSIDVYAGIRWWDNDIGATVDLALLPGTRRRKIKQDWVDPVIGVRWQHPFNDRWNLTLRGDAGGFGVESESTFVLMASATYSFKSNLAVELAYKALWVDFEDGTPQTPGYFAYDTATHGPLIGLVIKF